MLIYVDRLYLSQKTLRDLSNIGAHCTDKTHSIFAYGLGKIKRNHETLHSFESYAVIYISVEKEKRVSEAIALI